MDLVPRVIFEDDEIVVVNKPAGLVVNSADTTKNVSTLQDWVEKQLKTQNPASPAGRSKLRTEEIIIDGYNKTQEFENRSGIVHRLDKETSGIIIIAKNVGSFVEMQRQFKNGTVKKTYLALVHGRVVPWNGEINVSIGRLAWNRKRFGVVSEGRAAKTIYKTLLVKKIVQNGKVEELSFLQVFPQTGRTHQIRVHFQFIKHPIFADELYAGRKVSRNDRKYLQRHFLHAKEINFTHPKTHEAINLIAPTPQELVDFLSSLADSV